MKKLISILAVLIVVSIPCLSGCTTVSLVEDVTWVMEAYGDPDNLTEALNDVEVTLYFDSSEGTFSGNASVNTYSGTYQLSGTALTLPDEITITTMAGIGERHQQEETYLSLFTAADSCVMVEGKLHIICGDQVIIYHKD